ncbi:MAG: leucine-rich repeat protein, partial [Ruminiclostridium sp.]|nr:leucine-rich repeat protein [Ruminiclostridium sp.]
VENGFTDEEVIATETLEDGQLRIKRYIGKSSEIVIPSEIDGKAVVAIGDNAFENCTSIKSVVIPDSVKQIGYSAFLGCSSLKSVTIPESVTDIGEYALGYSYDDDSCKYIKSDDLEINYVKNSEGHYYAAKNKFTDEECLATYVLDDGTLAIKGFISSAESFVIPSKIDGKVITQIDSYAFAYCDNLKEATVPVSVTYIDSEALGYNYTGGEYNDSWNYSKNENFKINYIKNSEGHYYAAKNGFTDEECLAARATGDGTVSIRGYVGNATTLSIPAKIDGKSVTGIDDMAFYECMLNSVTIPDSVTTIGWSAFERCEYLEKIILPKNLEFIGSSAFSGCSSLKSVTLPDTTDKQIYIDDYAFNNCKSLVDIAIPKSVSYIGEETFGYYNTETWETKKIDGFKIKCYKDTAGEQYAKENSFTYELLDHTHSYGTWTTTKAATCTATGTQTRKCSCGAYETKTISALGHNYVTSVVKPTYTAKGYTLHKCSRCGNSYKDNYTNKLTLPSVTGLKLGGRTSNALRLNWNKNTSANGYIIEQYKSGKWVRIAKITSNATTTYRVSGLAAGTAYKFRMKAYKMSGSTAIYSAYTSTFAARTNLSNVTGVKIGGKASTALRLNWTKNTSANGYIVEIYKSGKWVRAAKITKNTTVTYRISGLAKNTTYKIRIKAYKMSGSTALYSGYTTISGKTTA